MSVVIQAAMAGIGFRYVVASGSESDITTPELRAAWQQGRKEIFYPYGKTYVQTLGEQD